MDENIKVKDIDPSLLKVAHKVFSEVPYNRLLGMKLSEMKVGEAILHLKMRDELRQPHGSLHGGATASLIDTAMAFAVVSMLGEGEKASTVDLTVHYLRPVTEGEIICTANVLRGGKRLLTVSAEVFNQSGKMIATAISTYSKV